MDTTYSYKGKEINLVILAGKVSVGKSRLFKNYLNMASYDSPTIGVEYA